MAKIRKTRKEKEKAVLRRLAQAQTFEFVKREFPTEVKAPSFPTTLAKQPEKSDKSFDFSFLLSDLRKTLIITSLILASEVVLYFIW